MTDSDQAYVATVVTTLLLYLPITSYLGTEKMTDEEKSTTIETEKLYRCCVSKCPPEKAKRYQLGTLVTSTLLEAL